MQWLWISAETPVPQATASALVKGQSAADVALQLVQVLFSLGLVVGLIFALAWFIRRNRHFTQEDKQIQFVERMSLGTKEQLVLVEVAGERLLLGVNAGGINTLHHFPAPCIAAAAKAGAGHEDVGGADGQQGEVFTGADGKVDNPSFASFLSRMLNQKVSG